MDAGLGARAVTGNVGESGVKTELSSESEVMELSDVSEVLSELASYSSVTDSTLTALPSLFIPSDRSRSKAAADLVSVELGGGAGGAGCIG
jgi:hypothetical protein